MTTLQSYEVLLRQTVTKTHTVNVEAKSLEHAKVLAEYAYVPSYMWQDESEQATAVTVSPVVHVPTCKEAHIPGMAEASATVEGMADMEVRG